MKKALWAWGALVETLSEATENIMFLSTEERQQCYAALAFLQRNTWFQGSQKLAAQANPGAFKIYEGIAQVLASWQEFDSKNFLHKPPES